jgi:hypothetical protein
MRNELSKKSVYNLLSKLCGAFKTEIGPVNMCACAMNYLKKSVYNLLRKLCGAFKTEIGPVNMCAMLWREADYQAGQLTADILDSQQGTRMIKGVTFFKKSM